MGDTVIAKKKPYAPPPVRPLNTSAESLRYLGPEPTWQSQPTIHQRPGLFAKSLNWYGYNFSKKDARAFIIDWLNRSDRHADAVLFAKVPDDQIRPTLGWVCRMNVVGLELQDREKEKLDDYFKQQLFAVKGVKKVVEIVKNESTQPNIQDRLRDKVTECAGEIEGMFDDFVTAGAKMSTDYKPLALMRTMNIAPQMVSIIVQDWKKHQEEFEEVLKGRDAQLVEGYNNFTKVQMKHLMKFADTVINDCGLYIQIKKSDRKPRKKKAVSPEKQVARFKYCKQFAELKLTSEPATSLVRASEAWLYNTKKRKLIHVVAAEDVGTFTIKGNSVIGFDPGESSQKTLRKPSEQIKKLMSVGKPAARKVFDGIRATDIKFNGRGSADLVILRAW